MGVCASRDLTRVLFYLRWDVDRLFGGIEPGLLATPSPRSLHGMLREECFSPC
jgi:hypothetical protein